MLDRASLDLVALSLEYPDAFVRAVLGRARPDGAALGDDLGGALAVLLSYLRLAPEHEPEERYTALFDLSPVCTLHVGYHLFGDAYQRGALLAGLAAEIRRAEVPQKEGELPDFLPSLLRLVARTGDAADRARLVDLVLRPGLSRMAAALAESEAPWAPVVRALPAALAPLGAGLPPPELAAPAPAPGEEAFADA